jgi:ABC-2 type transport system ATP-binding protein
MITLQGFGKDYGDFRAVDSLDLKIEAGETFGFIGPNGAGKSTTIRFLATLLRPSRGRGEVAGCDVVADPMGVRQAIGYMPDNFGVYDGMRVWEFLDFFAVAYRIGRDQRKRIIAHVLELLDLVHKRNDFVNGLSRGMKQRLCLAKTLLHDPPVLILDEPASGHRGQGAPQRAPQDGEDDHDQQPHPDRTRRLLHLDRDHRTGQTADARPHRSGQ